MSDKNDLVRDLRALADFLEMTEFPEGTHIFGPAVSVYVMADDSATFGEAVKTLGACEKSSSGVFLNAEKKFHKLKLQATVRQTAVCTRKKVGVRHVEAQSARTEDVYEWDCPESFLGLGRKA